ncbi:outer membrane beta-barrel protein [Nemorincola caseinilytica]
MKRILTLAICFAVLAVANSSYAQSSSSGKLKPDSRKRDRHRRHAPKEPNFGMGIKVGANMQYMQDSRKLFDNWIKPGAMAGIYFNMERGVFGVQLEGIGKTCRYYVKHAAYLHLRTWNVDFPILLTCRPFRQIPVLDRLKFVAGPEISFLVSAVRGDRNEVKNDFTNADVAAAAGIEIDLPLNLHVGARGLWGLVNINNTLPSAEWHNHSLQFTVGYRFLQ